MNHTPSGSCTRRRPDRCTEPACQERSRRYGKRLELRHIRGEEPRIPVAVAKERLERWTETYTRNHIAVATGLSERTISGILNGRYEKITRETERRILAFTPLRTGTQMVAALGAMRRVRALAVNGFSLIDQANRLGMPHRSSLYALARGDVEWIGAEKFARIDALFTELWDQRGPSRTARKRALEAGWLPAMAWDDIDDPAETPAAPLQEPLADPVAVERATQGERVPLTRSERVEAVARLAAAGVSDVAAAERLHLSPETVLRIRQRHGIAPGYVPVTTGARHLFRRAS